MKRRHFCLSANVLLRGIRTEVLRQGARELLQQAVEAEVAEFVKRHRELKDEHDKQRVVRNGYRPQRSIQTGIGAVAVNCPGCT